MSLIHIHHTSCPPNRDDEKISNLKTCSHIHVRLGVSPVLGPTSLLINSLFFFNHYNELKLTVKFLLFHHLKFIFPFCSKVFDTR